MHVLILGAGIIGLSTAYALRQKGHDVTVIDQHDEVAQGATLANGAQLSYSYVAPLAGEGVMGKIPKWLFNPSSPLRVKPSLHLSDICWNLRFLRACNATTSAQTTQELLKLAYLSRAHYHTLFENTAFQGIDYRRAGKLVIHRSLASLKSATAQLALQEKQGGMPQQALSTEECIRQEPALAPMASHIVGGIYTESEEAADAYKVSLALKDSLQAQGATFLMGKPIQKLEKTTASTVHVRLSDHRVLQADSIVVCMGAESTPLLSTLGITVPVNALKGYSLTLAIENDAMAPKVSITDFERKVVYARLGKRLRIAGMADLVGMDYRIDPQRIRALTQAAKAVFPQAGNYVTATPWAGLRPATPLGKPIIDRTPFSNLFLNIGHGALGFTLATGSADVLCSLIENNTHPLQTYFSIEAANRY